MTQDQRTTPAAPKRGTHIEEGEVLKLDIKIEAIARTIGFGNGNGNNRTKTEAFEIRVPLEIRLIIKEIMTHLGTQNSLPEGRFILYGLVQSVGPSIYKKMLQMQTYSSVIPVQSPSLASFPRSSSTPSTSTPPMTPCNK
jgi:hypothetical protein